MWMTKETRRNIAEIRMDTTLHDVITVHDVFFKAGFIVRVLEMAGDHDRLRGVRIPRSKAALTTTPTDRKQEDDDTHDGASGNEDNGDPRATIGEISCQLLMQEGQLLLAKMQAITELPFIIGCID
jgi:hypothetical protein